MGNANCIVKNDTKQARYIYVFNYADGIRLCSSQEFWLQPNEERKAEAAAHGSGLIIATGKGAYGRHLEVGNGETLTVSNLLKAPENQWFTTCVVSASVVGVAAAVATGGVVGGAVGHALLQGSIAATGCNLATGVGIGMGAGGTIGGAGVGAGYAVGKNGAGSEMSDSNEDSNDNYKKTK